MKTTLRETPETWVAASLVLLLHETRSPGVLCLDILDHGSTIAGKALVTLIATGKSIRPGNRSSPHLIQRS